MSVTLDFSPDVEARLRDRAVGEGLALPDLVRLMVEENLAHKEIQALKMPDGHWDYKRLMALPKTEQNRIMERAAKDAAPLYAADLALPQHLRELTAFEALNDYDPIYDYEAPVEYDVTQDSTKQDAS